MARPEKSMVGDASIGKGFDLAVFVEEFDVPEFLFFDVFQLINVFYFFIEDVIKDDPHIVAISITDPIGVNVHSFQRFE